MASSKGKSLESEYIKQPLGNGADHGASSDEGGVRVFYW
jgi:hypothetical protein